LPIYKTLAFGISASFAAVAGSMFVLANAFINPDVFPLMLSLELLIGAAVAGFGSLWGVIVGAAFVVLVPNALHNTQAFSGPQAGPVVFGLSLILVMLFFPGGAAQLVKMLGGLTNRGRDAS